MFLSFFYPKHPLVGSSGTHLTPLPRPPPRALVAWLMGLWGEGMGEWEVLATQCSPCCAPAWTGQLQDLNTSKCPAKPFPPLWTEEWEANGIRKITGRVDVGPQGREGKIRERRADPSWLCSFTECYVWMEDGKLYCTTYYFTDNEGNREERRGKELKCRRREQRLISGQYLGAFVGVKFLINCNNFHWNVLIIHSL